MHSVRGTPRAPGMTCTYNMWWPHAGGGEAFSPAQQCHAGQDVEKDVSLTQNSVRLIFFNLVKIQRLKFGCKTRASLSTTAEWTKLLNLGPWKCLWIFTPWDSEAAHSIFFLGTPLWLSWKKYVTFLKLCLLIPTFLLSSKSNRFHGSDSSDMSEGPNENYVEISFDKATSDKRNVKQIALHNGKWWTWADPCWWLGAKGKFEATHMFPFGKLSGFNVRRLYII